MALRFFSSLICLKKKKIMFKDRLTQTIKCSLKTPKFEVQQKAKITRLVYFE